MAHPTTRVFISRVLSWEWSASASLSRPRGRPALCLEQWHTACRRSAAAYRWSAGTGRRSRVSRRQPAPSGRLHRDRPLRRHDPDGRRTSGGRRPAASRRRADPFLTPCPEPPGAGGSRTAAGPVMRRCRQPWLSRRRAGPRRSVGRPAWPAGRSAGSGAGPARIVAYTDDLVRHEADLREVWGGPLCVIRMDRTVR